MKMDEAKREFRREEGQGQNLREWLHIGCEKKPDNEIKGVVRATI